MLTALLVSTAVVALGEMGDKTQLLAIVLAARWRAPWPIVAGIAVATVANHALAGAVGAWLATTIGENTLRIVVGVSFLAMAAWMLVPDKLDAEEALPPRGGVFLATTVAFFLAEMGDKTQIATVALAARFAEATLAVVAGTTLGMMIANVPAVWLGSRFAARIPMKWVHGIAAVIFAVLGVMTLLSSLA